MTDINLAHYHLKRKWSVVDYSHLNYVNILNLQGLELLKNIKNESNKNKKIIKKNESCS